MKGGDFCWPLASTRNWPLTIVAATQMDYSLRLQIAKDGAYKQCSTLNQTNSIVAMPRGSVQQCPGSFCDTSISRIFRKGRTA